MKIELRLHNFRKFDPRCGLVLLSGALLRRISGLGPGCQILYSTILGKLFGDCSATTIIIFQFGGIVLILLVSAGFGRIYRLITHASPRRRLITLLDGRLLLLLLCGLSVKHDFFGRGGIIMLILRRG